MLGFLLNKSFRRLSNNVEKSLSKESVTQFKALPLFTIYRIKRGELIGIKTRFNE